MLILLASVFFHPFFSCHEKKGWSILRLSENQTNLFAWLNVSKITEGKEKSPLQKKIGKEEYFAKTQNSSFYSLRL